LERFDVNFLVGQDGELLSETYILTFR
jgi:hypothetical protein